MIEASPFQGEGYRKIWARLRFRQIRTAARRVRRIMKEHGLLAPHRAPSRSGHPHDGTIVTDRVDQVGTVEELRNALAEFAALYNATWLRQRHGHRTPNQIRADQLGIASEAATEQKMAA